MPATGTHAETVCHARHEVKTAGHAQPSEQSRKKPQRGQRSLQPRSTMSALQPGQVRCARSNRSATGGRCSFVVADVFTVPAAIGAAIGRFGSCLWARSASLCFFAPDDERAARWLKRGTDCRPCLAGTGGSKPAVLVDAAKGRAGAMRGRSEDMIKPPAERRGLNTRAKPSASQRAKPSANHRQTIRSNRGSLARRTCAQGRLALAIRAVAKDLAVYN